MLSKYKKLLATGLVLALALGASACAPGRSLPESVSGTLRISYYSGKYGDAWIKSLAAAFTKLNPGARVTLDGDPKLDSKMGFILESGNDEPDIAFVSQTNWQSWADEGYITDLTGLFNGEASGGKKFSDMLQPGIRDYCKYEGKDMIVPWGDKVSGLIYNKEMFEHYNWAIPSTTAELGSLIDEIKTAGVAPFAWSGQNMGYWDEAVIGWWAQIEGVSGMKSYLKMASPQVYYQQGRLAGLNEYQQIITSPSNSIGNPAGTDADKAISEFYAGKAAMMPGGYITLMETKDKPPSGFDAAMIQLPAAEGAIQGDISCVRAGDFAFIPSKAKNRALAENFLAFMASGQALSIFTRQTGEPAPFIYDAASVKGLDSLGLSEAHLWQDDLKVYMYSANPVYYNEFFDWPYNGSPLMQIYSGSLTASAAFNENAEFAAANWQEAESEFGVSQPQSALSTP
jgi:N-acetylglucosamine transport system substrate-binding protein